MNILELLDNHPKAAIVIKQWFLARMLESLNTDSLPEEFKEYVRQQGIDNNKIADMVESNPRTLFTPFDLQKVYVKIDIKIQSEKDATFGWSINNDPISQWYSDRISAEKDAIKEAFKILNNKL